MPSFNSTTLIGHLTRDPEVKYLPSGTACAEFGLAVNENYKKDGQKVEEVSFFDITFFGRVAEVCGEYLHKGDACLVQGRLKQERWEQDGNKRSKVKIIGQTMQMLGGKGQLQDKQQHQADNFYEDTTSTGEVPF